jgi:hypothetical protein
MGQSPCEHHLLGWIRQLRSQRLMTGFQFANRVSQLGNDGFVVCVKIICHGITITVLSVSHSCISAPSSLRSRLTPKSDKDSKAARDRKIFDMWLACHTQEEIAEACQIDQGDLSKMAKSFMEIGNLAESHKSLASHASDFEPMSALERIAACLKNADIVAKVFLGWRPKFFRTADAFCARGYEGPHRFVQKRARSFVTALRSIAVVESVRNQRLRDFRRRSIFDFCNKICQFQTCTKRLQQTNPTDPGGP